jgi:ABC-type lipoprotein release transport system permease subunit
MLVVASTVGALAPLLGLAAVEGTVRQIQQRITGIGSFIDVRKKGDAANTCDQVATMKSIQADPRVKSVAPYVTDFVIIETPEDSAGVPVKAVDPESEAHTSHLGDYAVPHSSVTRIGSKASPATQVIVGMAVAKALHLKVGQAVTLSHRSGDLLTHLPTLVGGEVAGIFHTGLSADNFIILSIDDLSALANVPPGCITGMSILTDDMATSDAVAKNLRKSLGHEYWVTNWTERFPLYNQTILLLNRLTNLLTAVIVIITMTAITAIAMLVSYSKRKDFATLFALGLSIRKIRMAHVFLALTIGFVGFALTLVIAPMVCEYCNSYHLIQVPGALDETYVSFELRTSHILLVAILEICCLVPLGWLLPQSLGTTALTRILRDE